jgi:hypothetical protein
MNNQTNNSSGKPASKNNRNRNRKRSNNKRRPHSKGPKLSTLEKAYRSYLNLLEKHLDARRKYFELFHRADPRQLAKLERNFNGAIKELRDFEDNLSPDIKDNFTKKVNGLKLDTIYSTNHELSPDSQEVSHDLPAEEPHFLESQKESFNEDTEETHGVMDDYYAYKGLTPPTKEEDVVDENTKSDEGKA